MFKYTLAATLDEMDREGITVAECPLRSMRCLSLQNGRIVGIIGVLGVEQHQKRFAQLLQLLDDPCFRL